MTEKKTAEEILDAYEHEYDEQHHKMVYYNDAIKAMEAYVAQQKSEIKMPPKEAIVQYFNNHFNCHADVIIGDYETTEAAMTVDAVLKMIEWLRNQITEKK